MVYGWWVEPFPKITVNWDSSRSLNQNEFKRSKMKVMKVLTIMSVVTSLHLSKYAACP